MGLSAIDYFDIGVSRYPDRPCLVCEGEVLTYTDVQRLSCRIANALEQGGMAPGTRVAVLGHNSNTAFACVLGVLRAGGTWVPVNARNATAETVHILNHTDAQVLFYSGRFSDTVAAALGACPAIERAICIDEGGIAGHSSLEMFCAGAGADVFRRIIHPDMLATLSPSGGTTGSPKGVMTSHRTWGYRIAEVASRLAHPAPVNLVAAPMTHGAGAGALEMMPLGATHVVLPGFDPAAIVAAIEAHGVTHMFLPPTALYRLMAEPGIDKARLGSLAYMICGGAPIAPERLRQAHALFGDAIHSGYGGTEFGGGLCWLTGAEIAAAIAAGNTDRLQSCGRPSPLSRLEIVDDAGRPLPPGETGEIVVDGYVLASGYYKNEAETAQAFRPDGFHTGDIGHRDAEGYVHVTDRRKDMIISGGFNVYPSEVERVLLMHDAVQDCAVVGMADSHWGEVVTAVVEVKRGRAVDAAELEALCRAHLAGYKTPRAFLQWERLPRSPVGKVLKRAIREQLATEEGN